MNRCRRYLLVLLLVLSLLSPAVFAQPDQTPEVPAFTQQELDQMLAPVALYPDALLSQILMAATYPLEVVQAARWSKANPGLKGETAVKAVDDRGWDPSVKSLVAFPQILQMMDDKLDWTERVGDAFLAQQSQVMDTVQSLRQKAYTAGNLKSNEHYHVRQQGPTIFVESVYPDVIYVPYYDPFVVYGPWWWPAYRPVYWAPWPGYYVRPGVVFHWSIGIRIGHGFFFGVCDWPQRHIRIVDVRPFYYRQPVPVRHVWVHQVEHRRGVPYRSPSVHKTYVQNTNVYVNKPAKRHDYSERTRQVINERDKRGDDVNRDRSPATRKPTEESRNLPRPDGKRDAPEGKRERKSEQHILPTTDARQGRAAPRHDVGEQVRSKDDNRKGARPAVAPPHDRFVAQDRSERSPTAPDHRSGRGFSGNDMGGERDRSESSRR